MKQPVSEDYAAFVGIDWADLKHDVYLLVAGSEGVESGILEHTPEAIATWAGLLYQRFRGKPVAICLELDKGPLVYALREYDFLVLFPVNPLTLARYREAFSTSAADVQKYSGIAPVTERSGKQCSVNCRWRCPKFLRQTFVEWANKSIHHSFWAQAFYRQRRQQGQPIRPPCELLLSSGSESCFAAGRIEDSTMNQSIWLPSSTAALRY